MLIVIFFHLTNLLNAQSIPDQISSKQWEAQFWNAFRKEMCENENSYFKNCIQYRTGTCSSEVQKYYFSCIQKNRIPEKIKVASEGVQFAQKLSECISKRILSENEILSNNSQCKNRNKN